MLQRGELCRGSRNAEGGHLPGGLTHRAVPFYGRCCPDRTGATSRGFPTMPIATDAAFILPDDFAGAALMGRIWRPDLAGPSVVAIRPDGVFDITEDFPTASQLAVAADPARALRAARGERVGTLQDLLNNTPPDTRDPTRPWLLAPIDLQVIKAAGVTFALSMLERVIEERARGNPDSAQAIRAEVTRIVGTEDRKSTRLNSSHSQISYAVFCLKKKKKQTSYTRSVVDHLVISSCYSRGDYAGARMQADGAHQSYTDRKPTPLSLTHGLVLNYAA